jgi:hypothetical protein
MHVPTAVPTFLLFDRRARDQPHQRHRRLAHLLHRHAPAAVQVLVLTVDLPLTSNDDSGAVAANDMGTAAIIARLAVVEGQLKTAKGADKPNKEMEKTCLENALKTRSAVLDVNAVKTEDRAGGDNVFVRLSTGGKNAQSSTVALKDGQNHHFAVPLAGLLPITGPIKVELFDKHKPDSDNQLAEIGWASPYAAATNAATSSGASYNITVKFDK